MDQHRDNKFRNISEANGQFNILVVDDDPAIVDSILRVLATAGLKARSAASGGTAIAELQENHYHLVLLDLNMPDLDGADVLDFINRQDIDSQVVVISGETEINKAISILKEGAKDYIRKPFSADELLFSVNNVLEKVRLENENKAIIEKLEESEALHRFIVHNSPDLLYMLDRDGRFVFVNKNTIRLLGYSRKNLIGRHYSDIVHAQDVRRADFYFNSNQLRQNAKNLNLRLRTKDGKILYVEVRAINIEKKPTGGYKLGHHDQQKPNFIGTYGIARDVSERKRSEEIIRYQYNHDLLTGLPNRTLLNERLTTLIRQAQDKKLKFAVLFIDINRFKLINDTYGQSLGDALLQNLTEILRHCTREGDTLARLGGDEFILLLPDIDDEQDAICVANKIVNESSVPFRQNGHEVYTTLSVGIALYPEHGQEREELIQKADVAVGNAKAKTESRYYLYHNKLRSRSSTKVFTEKLIREAALNDRFVVHYQPQIDLQSSCLHAVEALVRINSAKGKLILPGKFIDIAEETSLISDIGTIVLERVCRDARAWQEQGLVLQISINVSAVQLATDLFAETVLEKITSYGLDPHNFEIELTENVLVQNMSRAVSNLLKMTGAGMKIAIDDFGIGYSSLSYLDRLPLTTLKLDRSFMRKIDTDNRENTIIPAVIGVAKGLKLNFIAEGVESRLQHEYLVQQGCQIAQGFYYSRPLNDQDLLRFIDRHRMPL
jgi:diguanylate cyclase (GGDEF)-like protein/PAS domain S-box-containing protein